MISMSSISVGRKIIRRKDTSCPLCKAKIEMFNEHSYIDAHFEKSNLHVTFICHNCHEYLEIIAKVKTITRWED